MEKIILTVTGMSCAHCERAVTNALEDLGATNIKASAANNTVELMHDPATLSLEAIKNEIVEMGYHAEV